MIFGILLQFKVFLNSRIESLNHLVAELPEPFGVYEALPQMKRSTFFGLGYSASKILIMKAHMLAFYRTERTPSPLQGPVNRVTLILNPNHPLNPTWSFMGSYKWGYK